MDAGRPGGGRLDPRRAAPTGHGSLRGLAAGDLRRGGARAGRPLVGPLASWREWLRGFPSRPTAVASPEPRAAFRSWFDGVPISVRTESVAVRADGGADPEGARRQSAPARAEASPTVGMGHRTASDRWLVLAGGIWVAGFLVFAGRLVWSACASARCWPRSSRSGRGARLGARGVRVASWGFVVGSGSWSTPTSTRRCAWGCSGRSSSGRARELPDGPAPAAREPGSRAGPSASRRRCHRPAGRGLAGADLVLPAGPPDAVPPPSRARISMRRPRGREAGDARALRAMAAGPGPGAGSVRRRRCWPRRSWAGRAWPTASGGSSPASGDGPGRSAAGPGPS